MYKKIILTAVLFIAPLALRAADESMVRQIYFPTDPTLPFSDDFGDGRYDHSHEGIDIMGDQMTPLYAAVDGRVSYLVDPEASWGYAVTLKDSDGYTYHYLHINNDTLGTDDGEGGTENAYAEGIKRGASVERGKLIGWMGDSGNAEGIGHHLHFEIREPDGTAINPYPSLVAALAPGGYDPDQATARAMNINYDKNLATGTSEAACVSGSLIKLADSQAVYYCGADGKRYVFTNDKVYFTWYDDFDEVSVLSAEEMASIPLGGNVTYRPGAKMLKLQTDPRVYAVDRGGVLRWVQSDETAKALYGEDWNQQIDDLPDSFFFSYTIGEPIMLGS